MEVGMVVRAWAKARESRVERAEMARRFREGILSQCRVGKQVEPLTSKQMLGDGPRSRWVYSKQEFMLRCQRLNCGSLPKETGVNRVGIELP